MADKKFFFFAKILNLFAKFSQKQKELGDFATTRL
jgi:hypothetical protein